MSTERSRRRGPRCTAHCTARCADRTGAALLVGAALAMAVCAGGCPARSSPPTPAPPPDLARAARPTPSFAGVIYPYLQRTCAQAPDCHGDRPNMHIDLDMRSAASAYAALVDVPSEQRRGAKRIKPFDPDASFIIAKLTGKLGDREGKAMPVDPETGAPLRPIPFDPSFVEDVMRPWIAAGAPRN